MSRELPVQTIIEKVATPGDDFIVMADTTFYSKESLDPVIEEIRIAHQQFIKEISRLTKEHKINVDIKTIVIADEHS